MSVVEGRSDRSNKITRGLDGVDRQKHFQRVDISKSKKQLQQDLGEFRKWTEDGVACWEVKLGQDRGRALDGVGRAEGSGVQVNVFNHRAEGKMLLS